MAQLLRDVDMEEERELQVLESRMPRVPVGVAGNVVSVMGTVLPSWVANVPICTQWTAMGGPASTGPWCADTAFCVPVAAADELGSSGAGGAPTVTGHKRSDFELRSGPHRARSCGSGYMRVSYGGGGSLRPQNARRGAQDAVAARRRRQRADAAATRAVAPPPLRPARARRARRRPVTRAATSPLS